MASSVAAGPTPAFAGGDRASARAALLDAVRTGAPDDVVSGLIGRLEGFDPSQGTGATSPGVGGEWRLLWSSNTQAFSPLLLSPLRPVSTQLVGDAATQRLGAPGRIAQILDLSRTVPVQLELSSGASPAEGDSRTLLVTPPFNFALVLGKKTYVIVAADSDADFRKVDARAGKRGGPPLFTG